MNNINTITDDDTMCHEALYGYDLDPEEVTPWPCHLYTSASDAVLYYYASDRTWWTIDEDTGETAATTEPSNLQHAEIDPGTLKHWAESSPWGEEALAHEAITVKGRNSIEFASAGFAAVIGGKGWGACIATASTIAGIVKSLRAYSKEHHEAESATLAMAKIKQASRRFLASYARDKETAFKVTPCGRVDLTDDALDEWGTW